MDRIPVQSSDIRLVGFENGVLEITFHSGGVYRFIHVPNEVHRLLMAAPSKGKFFNQHIRNKYTFQRLR